jgi:hypothetical protein
MCSIVAPGDPASVFDYVADVERHGFWQHDLLGRENVSMPRIETGTQWTDVRKLGSRSRRIEVTVLEASRPDRIAFEGRSGGFTGTSILEFRAEGPRTRIVHRTEVRARGLLALMKPLMRWHVQRTLQANLYRLTLGLSPSTPQPAAVTPTSYLMTRPPVLAE